MTKNLLIIVAIIAIGIGAYYVGTRHKVSSPAADADMPAAHPPIEAPDPSAHFTHFRVGESNVKSILADGEIIWVGTSGGVIRYDMTRDSYKLYDNRTGLLANGIFHLSKLDGQIVAGTYGGGMSILDEQNETWKTYNIPDGLGDGFIYDVLKLENGDVWIATWSGVNRVRGGDLDDRSKWDLFTVANTNGGLPNDWVYALQPGRGGAVWLATERLVALRGWRMAKLGPRRWSRREV